MPRGHDTQSSESVAPVASKQDEYECRHPGIVSYTSGESGMEPKVNKEFRDEEKPARQPEHTQSFFPFIYPYAKKVDV